MEKVEKWEGSENHNHSLGGKVKGLLPYLHF